jgi:PrtD family type I secretion system ABC transporter
MSSDRVPQGDWQSCHISRCRGIIIRGGWGFRFGNIKFYARHRAVLSGKYTSWPLPVRQALGACRSAFIGVFVFSFVINLLALTSSLYMMQVYDRVLGSRNEVTLGMLTAMALLALLAMAGLELVRGRLMVRLGLWLDSRLGGPVLTGAIRSVLRGGERSAQGLRDLSTFRTFLTGPSIFPLLDAPWVPLYLLVIFLLHPVLGWIATAAALLLFGLAVLNEFATRTLLRASGVASHRTQLGADQAARNAPVIEAMGMLPSLVERWQTRNSEAMALQAQASDRAGLIAALSRYFRVAVYVVTLGAGALLVLDNHLTAGMMVGASIILSRALAPIDQSIGAWRSFVSARTAFGRLIDLLNRAEERAKPTRLPDPVGEIAVEGIIWQPPAAKTPILRGISFAVGAGEIVGVIGPTGAGKTSLANLLVGTWRPQRGHVRLDGADLSIWEPEELGPHIGYLPQDVELFSGTVRDNIARLGRGEDEAVVAAAQMAGAHEMILGLAEGYETQIGEDGALLSGGQRQLIALARALYGNPKLLVLDEPNASLDAGAENRLVQSLGALKGKTTIVLITHRLNILGVADKILLMKNGTIEAFGPRDQIISQLTRAVPAPRHPVEVPRA